MAGGAPQTVQPVVAVAAPVYGQGMMQPMGSGTWSSGFCECCSPPGSLCMCCKGAFCPCCMYGDVAVRLTNAETTCGGSGSDNACCIYCAADYLPPCIGVPSLGCLLHCQARASVRRRYGIPEEPCCDICVVWCCASCSWMQIHKELILRNAPPIVNGIVPIQQQQVGYVPVAGGAPQVVVAQPVNEMR